MEKKTLIKFIDKYHLSGICESVVWTSENGMLKTNFSAENKTMIGALVYKKSAINDSTFGIYTTSDLLKMLSAVSENIEIIVKTSGDKFSHLQITDNNVNMNYILSDPTVIPSGGSPKKMPDFNVDLTITTELMDRFIKSHNALGSESFAIRSMGDNIEFIIGYSINNTNRITFRHTATIKDNLNIILFNAEYFKQILMANKSMSSGKISISSAGIMKIQFIENDYQSEYYMVQLQN